MSIYKELSSAEVANLLRELDPTLKNSLKTLAFARGIPMCRYVNMIVEAHIRQTVGELEKKYTQE